MRPRNPHAARPIIRVALVAAGAATLRRKSMRWGATHDEARAPLPGDDLLPRADLAATRAITIRAGGGDVWPWLVQLGQDRGGFYTYEWLENLVGADPQRGPGGPGPAAARGR